MTMFKRLFIFFALAYLLSWLIWLPLYAPALGFTLFEPLRYQHALGAFGPLLAGLYVSYRFKGLKGFGYLILKSFFPTGLLFLLIALFSPFLLEFLAAVIHYFQSRAFPDLSQIGRSREFPESGIVVFFFYNLLFFGFGEEVGWRGFALPELQSRYNALISSLILTLFWALWHWPLFLYRPGYMSMDLAGATGWLLSLLTGSILLTWLFNSSRGSVLACAVFHSAIDVAFTFDYLDKNLVGLMGMLIILWGISLIFIVKPKNLSRNQKVTALDGDYG